MFSAGILPSLDLFSGGRKIALLKFKKLQYEHALNDYQNVILSAIKEINSSLIDYKSTIDNYNEAINRLKFQNKLYSLILDKTNIGSASDLDLLYAKEALLFVQKDEASNKINTIIASIGLFKATGGINLYTINDNI